MSTPEEQYSITQFTQEVVQSTHASKSYEPAFKLLFEVAKRELGAFKMSFWRYATGENAIVCELVLGGARKGVAVDTKIPTDSPIADYVLSRMASGIVAVPAEELRGTLQTHHLLEEKTTYCYLVPLKLHSDLLGGFCFEASGEVVGANARKKFEAFLEPVALAYCAVRRQTSGTKRLLHTRLLHQISERALMQLDVKDILSTTVKLLKNYFLYYNAYIFLFRPEDDTLELEAFAGAYADKITTPFKLHMSQGCIGQAFRTRRAYYCRNTREDPTYVPEFEGATEALSELAVPITQGENVLGVLDVQADQPDAFDHFDIETMETLAHQIATALVRAHDYQILRNYSRQLELHQMQMEQDLKISEQILSINLPKDFASPYVETNFYFKAHHSIGGDIAILRSADIYSYAIVGDVSGHGISSALISTSSYAYLNNLLNKVPTPETLVHSFNEFWVLNFAEVGHYATLFVGRLHNLTGSMEYINCAHPEPIVYHSHSGNLDILERQLPPIGLFELQSDADIQRRWVKLERDDKVLLYTDGLLREYPTPGRFHEDDLKNLARRFGSYTACIFHQLVLAKMRKMTRGLSSADDEVLITLSYTGRPQIGGYIETVEDTISLLRKVNIIGTTISVSQGVLDALSEVLEETALALLARKKEAIVPPRLFVNVDFQPKKFSLMLLDANLFFREENLIDESFSIPPLEEQLPPGTLRLIKAKLGAIEIKKIERGLLFSCQLDRARALAQS